MKKIIIAHGGAGAPKEFEDGTRKAATAGFELLKKGSSAVDAVEAAITVLEDDVRFNAGTGSNLRLNGVIEMDAAIMCSDLRCGAVGALRNVKNPIKVARKVMETPHVLLVGEGALRFARKSGFDYYDPISEKAVKKLKWVKERLRTKDLPYWAKSWKDFDVSEFCSDTVGAVAWDGKIFVAGTSTGGTSFMLPGRVGDSALIGCGIYANQKGAISTTGIGEEIIKRVLAKAVYLKIEQGLSPKSACEYGMNQLGDLPTGLIAISADDYAVVSNKEMPATVLVEDQ